MSRESHVHVHNEQQIGTIASGTRVLVHSASGALAPSNLKIEDDSGQVEVSPGMSVKKKLVGREDIPEAEPPPPFLGQDPYVEGVQPEYFFEQPTTPVQSAPTGQVIQSPVPHGAKKITAQYVVENGTGQEITGGIGPNKTMVQIHDSPEQIPVPELTEAELDLQIAFLETKKRDAKRLKDFIQNSTEVPNEENNQVVAKEDSDPNDAPAPTQVVQGVLPGVSDTMQSPPDVEEVTSVRGTTPVSSKHSR